MVNTVLKRSKVVCFLLMMLIAGYPSVSISADGWAADEILQQLSELRRDHNALRKQVEELRVELARKNAGSQPKKEVSLDNEPSIGNKNAKVVMVEFTDYQCPFCQRHTQKTFPQLKEGYIDTGKLFYVMKDYPLAFHDQAKPAAVAANCAGEQGAYWAMHEQLFASGIRLGKNTYKTIAQSLSLDSEVFEACLDDPEQAKEVDADFAEGSRVGVRGTPAFFIGKLEGDRLVNGVFVGGAQSFNKFSGIIDGFYAAE
ncbi:MAG: DsbA family protein [Gammaproteobacteria bacterium]|nr:DsbA family protein [Gammaproteobacteria bacterium]